MKPWQEQDEERDPHDIQDVVPVDGEAGGEVVPFRFRPSTDDESRSQDTVPDDDSELRWVQIPSEQDSVDSLEVVEGELLDPATDTGITGVPVDYDGPAVELARWHREVDRRPVVPVWLRDKAEAKTAARWAASHTGHIVAFHLVRVPKYGGTLAARAPRGLGRVLGGTARWLTDAEGKPLRHGAVRSADAAEYMRLSQLRADRVKLRGILFTFGLVLGGTVLAMIAAAGPGWLGWVLVAGLVAALGVLGAPGDVPLTGRSVVTHEAPKLTPDMIVRALGSLGIAEINKAIGKGQGITFAAPVTRDGPGFRADVDLPYGVTAVDIMDRRDRVASGLRRPLGCVWPEPAHDQHAGRLVLWVGDQDLSRAKPARWPLLKGGKVDVFSPIPFGTDQRGRPVTFTLMYDNGLIGAMPGYGKTFALRGPLLAVALDPLVSLWLYELKGTGDLETLEQVSERYASGADDEAAEAALAGLRELREEVRRRAGIIKRLPKDVCPENKVTAELSKRHKGLRPIVMAIDECQNLFTHPVYGDEAGELATAIIKLGRALGVMLLLATQRPDAKSLPTGVSANVGIRFCLRVMGQLENDMVLGTSAYKNGVRATTLTTKDKGIGYLVGASDDAQVVRTYYIDSPTAQTIALRAKALRAAAGTLTGHAVGDAPDTNNGPSVLVDVAAVIGDGEDKLWSETLVARLVELRPDHYRGWTPPQLATALAPYGITTRQMQLVDDNGRKANRRGVTRADVLAALDKHKPAGSAPTDEPPANDPAGDNL